MLKSKNFVQNLGCRARIICMKLASQLYSLAGVGTITVRTLGQTDTSETILYMKNIYKQTPYLARYGDAWTMTAEQELSFLRNVEASDNEAMLACFLGSHIVGLCNIFPMDISLKGNYRCQIGVSVSSEYRGRGIGSLCMEKLLLLAQQAGYSQMELEVVASNQAAIRLYDKFGFQVGGRIIRGFRHKEGSYEDLLYMVKEF